jgi:hypothetical protein
MPSAAALTLLVATMPDGPTVRASEQYEAMPIQQAMITILFILIIYGITGIRLYTAPDGFFRLFQTPLVDNRKKRD